MTSKLKANKPELTKRSKPKTLVFGQSGTGKTWCALDFPFCYFIDTEGGASEPQYKNKLINSGGAYLGKEKDSQNFEVVIEQIKALATEKHGYKTLIIDSFTKLWEVTVAKEIERLTTANTKIEFAVENKPAAKLTKRLIGWIDKLDMNVLLICHSKEEYFKGEMIGRTFDGYKKLDYEMQLCLEITKQGNSRKAFVKKSRIEGFPDADSFDWSYESFCLRLGKELLESEASPALIATPEQINRVKGLLNIIKLDDSIKDKYIAENYDTFEEMESEKLASIITYLTAKLEG